MTLGLKVFLVEVPSSTMEHDSWHWSHNANSEVREWLDERNIVAWSVIFEEDGRIKFIFIDEVHAMLFRLRWS